MTTRRPFDLKKIKAVLDSTLKFPNNEFLIVLIRFKTAEEKNISQRLLANKITIVFTESFS